MTELCHPMPDDEPQLRQLWKDAFGDEDAYLDLFFHSAFSHSRCLTIRHGSNILGAAHWMDCTLREHRLAYVYAVAIAADHRGKGLGTTLMDGIHGQLCREGYAGVLLVPGNEALRQYYRRFGYETVSYLREFSANRAAPVPLQKIDGEQYARLRRQFLPENGVIQEGESLALMEGLADFYAGEDFIAAMARNEALGLELLGDPHKSPGITAALGLPQCRFRSPGGDLPYAMGKALRQGVFPQSVYFGFGFD